MGWLDLFLWWQIRSIIDDLITINHCITFFLPKLENRINLWQCCWDFVFLLVEFDTSFGEKFVCILWKRCNCVVVNRPIDQESILDKYSSIFCLTWGNVNTEWSFRPLHLELHYSSNYNIRWYWWSLDESDKRLLHQRSVLLLQCQEV